MDSISNHDYTVIEVAADFLSSLPLQDREKIQTEVHKFVRWLGLYRRVEEISPTDVASYGEQITPAIAKFLKSFLTYIRKRGGTTINLAPHLRAKKSSAKVVSIWQNSREQSTLTAQGYAKLEAELADLKNQLSKVIEEMQEAAADKDFSENAPLDAAREQKGHIEGRIKELESTLKLAKIMGEYQETPRIKIGDTVVLYDISLSKEISYALVDPREANAIKGKISVASPLGKVLLDKEKGQTVEVAAPAGVFCYCIRDIHR